MGKKLIITALVVMLAAITVTVIPFGCGYDGYITSADAETGEYYLLGRESGGKDLSLILPNGIEGHTYDIAEKAFESDMGIGKLTIGNGVRKIGAEAFRSCIYMKKLTFKDGVTEIGDSAFASCFLIEEVKLPSSLEVIGDNVFMQCSNIERAVLPEGLKSIGSGMFYACFRLADMTLPDDLTEIPDDMFYGCTDLEELTIPRSVMKIGNNAFGEEIEDHPLTIKYEGTEAEWNAVAIGDGNERIDEGTVEFAG